MRQNDKIAMVLSGLPVGGAEKVAVDLAIGLSEYKNKTVKIFVLSGRSQNQFTELLEQHNIECCFLGDEDQSVIGMTVRFFKALKRFDPYAVHAHMDRRVSWVWALLHNRKILFTIHSQPKRILDTKTRFLYKLLKKRDLIKLVAVSDTILKETVQELDMKDINIVSVYNPVRIPKHLVSKDIKEEQKVQFVNVARFVELKNHRLLLSAFSDLVKENYNAHLTLAGDGPLLEEMKRFAEELNISENLTFAGNVRDIGKLLEKSDVFVLSSTTEAFPVSIVEAMSYSLPVIATDVGGVSDVVHENGILVASQNKEQLTDAMKRMIENVSFRKKCAECSFRDVQRFSVEKIVDRYSEVYDEWFG